MYFDVNKTIWFLLATVFQIFFGASWKILFWLLCLVRFFTTRRIFFIFLKKQEAVTFLLLSFYNSFNGLIKQGLKFRDATRQCFIWNDWWKRITSQSFGIQKDMHNELFEGVPDNRDYYLTLKGHLYFHNAYFNMDSLRRRLYL